MKRFLFSVAIVLLSATSLLAEPTSPEAQRRLSDANVFGHILDAATGEHIPYVTISVKGTTIGTVADAT
jgi:outer membrane receptor for ferrienterochelin and colicins